LNRREVSFDEKHLLSASDSVEKTKILRIEV